MTLSNGHPAEVKIDAIRKAIERSDLSQTEKLILAGLILRANDDLKEACAGATALSRYASVKRRDAVFAAIWSLEHEHKLIDRRSRGNGKSNAYDIVPDRLAEAAVEEFEIAGSGWVDPSALEGRVSTLTRPLQQDGLDQNPSASTGRVEIVPVLPNRTGLDQPVRPKRTGRGSGSTAKAYGLESHTRPPKQDGFDLGPEPCSITHASARAEDISLDLNTGVSIDRPESVERGVWGEFFSEPVLQPAPKAKRATRLPDDWTLPEDWRTAALEQFEITADKLSTEAASFRDFWISKSGANATKIDWHATWRNWVRKNHRDRLAVNATPVVSLWWKDDAKVRAVTPEQWVGSIRRHANGLWPTDKLGPAPGSPNCLVPADLARELRLEEFYTHHGILRDPQKSPPWSGGAHHG